MAYDDYDKKVVRSDYELLEFANEIPMNVPVGIDIETSGLEFPKDYLVGMTVAVPALKKVRYISVRSDYQNSCEPKTFKGFLQILSAKNLHFCFHNAGFDLLFTYAEYGFLPENIHDSYIVANYLQEQSASLKDLALALRLVRPGEYPHYDDLIMKLNHFVDEKQFKKAVKENPSILSFNRVDVINCPEAENYVFLDGLTLVDMYRQLYKDLLDSWGSRENVENILAINHDALKMLVKSSAQMYSVNPEVFSKAIDEFEQEVDSKRIDLEREISTLFGYDPDKIKFAGKAEEEQPGLF